MLSAVMLSAVILRVGAPVPPLPSVKSPLACKHGLLWKLVSKRKRSSLSKNYGPKKVLQRRSVPQLVDNLS